MKRIGRTAAVAAACFALTLTLVAPSSAYAAGVLFSDNFDAETANTFPSTWAVNGTNPGITFLVTDSASVSTPHAFRISDPSNDGYEVARFFATTTVTDNASYEIAYQLNVTAIPNGATNGNVGFQMSLGQGTAGGGFVNGFNAAAVRVFSESGSTTQYRLFDPHGGAVFANNLAVGAFQDVRVTLTPSGPGTGSYFYTVNGVQSATFNYAGAPTTFNGFRVNSQLGTGADADVTFVLDDASIVAVPEPVGAALFVTVLALFARRRGRLNT